MRLCPRCGTGLDLTYPLAYSFWVERCPACGYEVGGTVSFAIPEEHDADRAASRVFRLAGLALYPALRSILPARVSTRSTESDRMITKHGLCWQIGNLKLREVSSYQVEAAMRGQESVIDGDGTEGGGRPSGWRGKIGPP